MRSRRPTECSTRNIGNLRLPASQCALTPGVETNVDVRIGISQSMREIEVDIDDAISRDDLKAHLDAWILAPGADECRLSPAG